MYNFLDSKLKPTVCVDCPESDGFEVENLISENENIKSKGFIAYSAIRPPINVDFVFICPIKICYILIWTSAGAQKSTSFEFQSRNSNSDYFTICKTHTSGPGIVIYNRHLLKDSKNIPHEFIVEYCKNSKFLNATERLRVKILRTINSVPCIGRIEVWGYISRTCSKTTKNTIQQLATGRINKNPTKCDQQPTCSKNIQELELFNIPDEFIDPISCEIMCLPMTLPSGKTVDQSTLEKHQENEAKWGRSPSDPFTAQVFTNFRRPVLNTALKSQIDKFLLENANNENTFQLQRTLGRKINETSNLCRENNVNQNESKEELDDMDQANTSMSDDLDTIISQSIKKYNIRKFTNCETNNEELPKSICGSCKIDINLYNLPCTHLICRSCLLVSINSVCKICNIKYSKYDVTKRHS